MIVSYTRKSVLCAHIGNKKFQVLSVILLMSISVRTCMRKSFSKIVSYTGIRKYVIRCTKNK